MSNTIKFEVNPERVRQLAYTAVRREYSTAEAEAFMLLYRDKLQVALQSTFKQFLIEKLGE